MMAALRRLVGLVDRDATDDDQARQADEVREQVARLLTEITAETQRLQQRKGWRHGGRAEQA